MKRDLEFIWLSPRRYYLGYLYSTPTYIIETLVHVWIRQHETRSSFLRKLKNNFIFEMDWDTIDGFKERGQNLKPFRDGTFVYGGRGEGVGTF